MIHERKIMAWIKVESYSLGYSIKDKKFLFNYNLEGDKAVYQIFPTAEEFIGLADMFRNEGPVNFNSTGNYFTTDSEAVGRDT
jgi:hypothetical protein